MPRTVADKTLLNGNWKLTYTTTNRSGAAGFGGRMLTSYKDAVTGGVRNLYNNEGLMTPGYFIDTLVTIFKPEEDPYHRVVLDWLIAHPEVGVQKEHIQISQQYHKIKNDNPQITLVNLDHEDVTDLIHEDFIDKLIGKIVIDAGPNAISLEKLRFILSTLERPYRDAKYMNDTKIEKQKLRQHLKAFIRSSYENAEKVEKVLENLDKAKFVYQIKEMLRLEILSIHAGMYKYLGNPLGTSTDSIIQYFNNNPEFYKELEGLLYEALKNES